VENRKKTILILLPIILFATFAFGRLAFRTSIPNVSAIAAEGTVGIYRDKECTITASSIEWGVLSPGDIKKVTIYVRNEGNESIVLVLTPSNWNPVDASTYLGFTWGTDLREIGVGKIASVTPTLQVSPYIRGISVFNFDMTFEGRKPNPCDINLDGYVNMRDINIVTLSFGSRPFNPKWNPAADLNNDGVIDMHDIGIVCSNFGKE
jgi:hypothetical protein